MQNFTRRNSGQHMKFYYFSALHFQTLDITDSPGQFFTKCKLKSKNNENRRFPFIEISNYYLIYVNFLYLFCLKIPTPTYQTKLQSFKIIFDSFKNKTNANIMYLRWDNSPFETFSATLTAPPLQPPYERIRGLNKTQSKYAIQFS